MVRHIRRGYDGTDENPLLMRWTIPAALMYCITIYTTIGTVNVEGVSSLNFYRASKQTGARFVISANNVQKY